MRRTRIKGPLLVYHKGLRLWVLKSIGRCGHVVTACFAVEPTDDQEADAHENARLHRLCAACFASGFGRAVPDDGDRREP